MTITVKDALAKLDDRRVKATRPLIPPAILQEDLPLWVLFVWVRCRFHTYGLYVFRTSVLQDARSSGDRFGGSEAHGKHPSLSG